MATLAAVALLSAAPAFATATIVDQNGPDLSVKIHASQDDPLIAPNIGYIVFGNAGPANTAGHNTSFEGFSAYNKDSQTGTNTTIDIKDGGGFAQLNDHDFDKKIASTMDLYAVIMDPTPAFTDYEFSIMLAGDGMISVYYMLTGDTTWTGALGNPLATGGNDNQFILSGLAPGQSFDKILIVATGSTIYQLKQNSIDLVTAQAVPEPASWALMLLGFGGMGMALRRSRKAKNRLLQIA